MSGVSAAAVSLSPKPTARAERILDAAEACFVRNGFHRTTMQDIAREAVMSAGNIYRYFDSKEEVVISLAERDRMRGAALVDTLENGRDRRAVFEAVINEFFVDTPRETAILRVDLWSEATRNPTIAVLTIRQDEEARAWFLETLSALSPSPDYDAAALCGVILSMLKGILIERALVPGFDPAPAVKRLFAIIDASLAGRLPMARAEGETAK